MGKKDLATLVGKEDTHWWAIRPSRGQIANEGCDEQDSGQYGDRDISSLQ